MRHRSILSYGAALLTSLAFGLLGCSVAGGKSAEQQAAAIVLTSSAASVRANNTAVITATQGGVAVIGGAWAVAGGTVNGSIDAGGTYHAPPTVPATGQASITYTIGGVTSAATIAILNPIPVVASVTPNIVVSPTRIVVVGTQFVAGSVITVNAAPIPTTYIDSDHLSGTVTPVPNQPLATIAVINPNPGMITSQTLPVSQVAPSFNVSTKLLSGGSVSIAITGTELPTTGNVLLDGNAMTVTSASATSIIATGFLAPWKVGTTTVAITADGDTTPIASQAVSIKPTPVSFDVAARFSTQAAFGPRPDVVQHIQQIGLSAFLAEQFGLPGVTYNPGASAQTQYLRAIQSGNSLLRLRLAWALQSFIVSQGTSFQPSVMPYETLLERDCTGNFRDLLTDISQDPSITWFLNLPGNMRAYTPDQHPNQNWGRELMQVFTLGANLLNDDGSFQLDSSGNPIPTYTQAQVEDLSRAFTGWNQVVVDPAYTNLGIDYSEPLQPVEGWHDYGSKVIVGNVFMPAFQGIVADRKLALDTIFQHSNLPPFVSHILIQRLVKSAPSPAYINRISKVFEDDGTGVRGNLTAVVTAILLDPEARSGDTQASADDGFLQDPFMFQVFTTAITELPISDDEPSYYGQLMNEPWWYAHSVFGYFSPGYLIPGTSVPSPEFQLFSGQTVTVRSEILWGFLTGSAPGYGFNYSGWLYSNFTNVSDFIDALNHLAFHGQMPANEKALILAYCQQLDPGDLRTQLQSALFLALNGDNFTVTH